MKRTRSKKRRWIAISVVVVVVALVFIVPYTWFYGLTRGPLPQHDGELTVDGLNDPVEIVRDKWGVPHIYATNMHDLFFAQGYTQAQDRWWQMEFSRHTGSGTLEELTGKNTSLLATDIFIRGVGWRRVAEQELESYDSESMAYLQAFADGVNAYIMNRDPGDLALEYSVLGLTGVDVEIEPWTPADSGVWAKVMAWDLGPKHNEERTRSKLYELYGPKMTDQWMTPPWPFGERPTIIQPEDLGITESTDTTQAAHGIGSDGTDTSLAPNIWPDMSLGFGHTRGLGSNSWVVSGEMTESGAPLLANDPHLGIQMPSVWYEVGLHCQPIGGECGLDVTGFALPATPGIVIGHNNFIAWGLTNVGPDVFDLYRIRVNPANPLQYEWNGQWRDMIIHNETIYFGDGAEPITIEVRETHLGPIINDNQLDEDTGEVLGFNNEDPLALRWTALDPGSIMQAITGINKATNWEEFRSALQYWDVPSQNFVYADIEGNIGYQTPGRIPIRVQDHSGLVPVPGWTDEFEWQGFIPYESLPSVFNPERGYIATANQALVPLEYYGQLAQELGEGRNYVISREWNYGYRGQRIVELLEDRSQHSISSFQAMHGDNTSISAKELLPYLGDLQLDDTELTEVRNWLLEWDCRCNMDSPQAALYAEFWASLVNNLYGDQLGEDIEADGNSREMRATQLLLEEPDNPWWDDIATNEVAESRDDILIRSLGEAYANTVATLGDNRDDWRWGDLHTATFVSNPLGASGIGPIESMVNRGPFAVSGSTGTLNNTYWIVPAGFAVDTLPSMRMIVDLGDLARSISMHTTGESGHPYSHHYDDMIDHWRNIEYHPMLWTPEQVEAAAVDRLTLRPSD